MGYSSYIILDCRFSSPSFEILVVQSYPHLHVLMDHLNKEFGTLLINVPLHGTQTCF
jgi:hypothetical protein